MVDHPTLYELEQAILGYTSSAHLEAGRDWPLMEWLWGRLPWSARLVTHFGAKGSSWWKERYIFPILCAVGAPYLQQFLLGEWTRAEEEYFRQCFYFFAPYALKDSTLFSPEVTQFLSGTCPSFRLEREAIQSNSLGRKGEKTCFWLRDESFAHYRSRIQALLKEPGPTVSKIVKEERFVPGDAIKEGTREKNRKLIEEIIAFREEILRFSSQCDRDIAQAFPVRNEAEGGVSNFQDTKEEIVTLLLSVDDMLIYLPDPILECSSDDDMRQRILEAGKALRALRVVFADLTAKNEQHRSYVDTVRIDVTNRIHRMTRTLDHIPMLGPSHSFRNHQMRLLKGAREKIKRFRSSLSRGPGPEMSLSLLEHEIASYEKLAYSLHEEEKAIGSMRERLHRFEDQIRTVQSGERSLTEDQAEWLQRLFTEVVQLQSSLELSPDRQCAFDRIEQAMHYLSEIHSHGKSSFSANMQLLYKTESGSDINLSMSLGN